MVSWECGGGGGVSVGLEPSDDNPHWGTGCKVASSG